MLQHAGENVELLRGVLSRKKASCAIGLGIITAFILFALFSPAWRHLALHKQNATSMDSTSANDAVRSVYESEFKIPRQMGILKNRCSYSDEDNEVDYTTDNGTDMNAKGSIINLLNYGKTEDVLVVNQNKTNSTWEFCSLWDEDKPVSELLVMAMMIVVTIMDMTGFIIALVACCALNEFTYGLVASNLGYLCVAVGTLILTAATFMYAGCNQTAEEAADNILGRLADPALNDLTREVPSVDMTLGSGFYSACAALVLHWVINIAVGFRPFWPRIARLLMQFRNMHL